MMLKNLNSRERNLAFLLGAIAFLLLNLFFLPKLTVGNRSAKNKHTELKARLAAAEGWIQKEAYWTVRRDWLAKTEPQLTADRGDSATQLEQLQEAAKESGLKIGEIQLLQIKETEFLHPVGVQLTVNGPWAGLVRFVARIQDPQSFNVIPRFSIRSDQEPPNVLCELEIQKWFHTPSESAP